MELFSSVMGWVSMTLGIMMFTPQAYKIIKARSAAGLSKLTFSIAAIGTTFWLVWTSAAFDGLQYQPLIANAVILLLMYPIIFFLHRDDKFMMALMFAIMTAGAVLSIAWNIPHDFNGDGHTTTYQANSWLSMFLVTAAGACTSFGYIPQIIKIAKTKTVGEFSPALSMLNALSNILWALFWGFQLPNAGASEKPSEIISMVFSISALIINSALTYLYFHFKTGKGYYMGTRHTAQFFKKHWNKTFNRETSDKTKVE